MTRGSMIDLHGAARVPRPAERQDVNGRDRRESRPARRQAARDARAGAGAGTVGALERALIDRFQDGFPLSPTPYADLGAELGCGEAAVLEALAGLEAAGILGRVGAVIRPHAVGASTLVALAVPPARLEAVAALVNGYPGVNHNYQREHHYNLWFVLVAADGKALQATLDDIEQRAGLPLLRLPMLEDYHIDLGFPIRWS